MELQQRQGKTQTDLDEPKETRTNLKTWQMRAEFKPGINKFERIKSWEKMVYCSSKKAELFS